MTTYFTKKSVIRLLVDATIYGNFLLKHLKERVSLLNFFFETRGFNFSTRKENVSSLFMF